MLLLLPLLLLPLVVLAVHRGGVAPLAAVVAAAAAAHPATQHGREDDLDAVQARGQVGPWEAQAHAHPGEQETEQGPAGEELHPGGPRCDMRSAAGPGGKVYTGVHPRARERERERERGKTRASRARVCVPASGGAVACGE